MATLPQFGSVGHGPPKDIATVTLPREDLEQAPDRAKISNKHPTARGTRRYGRTDALSSSSVLSTSRHANFLPMPRTQ
jgi:hypothetical protein